MAANQVEVERLNRAAVPLQVEVGVDDVEDVAALRHGEADREIEIERRRIDTLAGGRITRTRKPRDGAYGDGRGDRARGKKEATSQAHPSRTLVRHIRVVKQTSRRLQVDDDDAALLFFGR